jgi:diguanylate cyclase (GGDEF)-like protein
MSVKKLNKEVAKKIKRVLLKVSDETSLEKVIEDLYDLATQDLKTGLLNFTAFSKILDLEAEQAKRGKQKLTLIVLDIDFFKKINDTYGHIKADELLSRLANILKKTVRKGDILARFGGEEFVILLPETSLNKSKN